MCKSKSRSVALAVNDLLWSRSCLVYPQILSLLHCYNTWPKRLRNSQNKSHTKFKASTVCYKLMTVLLAPLPKALQMVIDVCCLMIIDFCIVFLDAS